MGVGRSHGTSMMPREDEKRSAHDKGDIHQAVMAQPDASDWSKHGCCATLRAIDHFAGADIASVSRLPLCRRQQDIHGRQRPFGTGR